MQKGFFNLTMLTLYNMEASQQNEKYGSLVPMTCRRHVVGASRAIIQTVWALKPRLPPTLVSLIIDQWRKNKIQQRGLTLDINKGR